MYAAAIEQQAFGSRFLQFSILNFFMGHSVFLVTALEAARAAADVIRRYYQHNLEVINTTKQLLLRTLSLGQA